LTDNDQSSMYTEPDSERNTLVSLQTGLELSHGSKDNEPNTGSTLGIIVVGLGIPKIDQESIPKELGDVTVKAGNHF